MEQIRVADLPEPIARALDAMVETLRQQLSTKPEPQVFEVPKWEGTVIGKLTREEIYDDVA